MDKWKDIELEKMKVGGNKKAKQFLNDQPDWSDSANITNKYNSKVGVIELFLLSNLNHSL